MGEQIRILIADDNAINREFLCGVLAVRDYQIDQADNGARAIELCETSPYALILMDIRMPEVDGILAANAIRKMDRHQRTPIIALTADLQLERRGELDNAGFSAILGKPVSRDELLRTLAECLGKSPEQCSEASNPFDVRTALAATGGNRELLERLTGMMMTELDEFIPAIENAIANGDCAAAHEIAHKLRASSGYCGALDLQRTAQAMESAAKNGDDAKLRPCFEDLKLEVSRLETYLAATNER